MKAYRWLRECRPAEQRERQFHVGETFQHFNVDKRSSTSSTVYSSSLTARGSHSPADEINMSLSDCRLALRVFAAAADAAAAAARLLNCVKVGTVLKTETSRLLTPWLCFTLSDCCNHHRRRRRHCNSVTSFSRAMLCISASFAVVRRLAAVAGWVSLAFVYCVA